jgi:hypothetical protein
MVVFASTRACDDRQLNHHVRANLGTALSFFFILSASIRVRVFVREEFQGCLAFC